ncbi:MAG: DUF962 domain-containing protein [Alphaproteobacteria bacterium]|nr:DUF962 domain-containing protein [Alphaproteobacteria bacterium]
MKNWFLEQLAMYSAYHRDGRNQATHHIGVPMIVFSLLVITSPVVLFTLEVGTVSLAAVLITVLLLYYLLNAPLIGTIAVLLYGALLYAANLMALEGSAFALKSGAMLFVIGWIIQFTGHVFEGRKPALFDNFTQVFIAPAFLIAEVLFLIGLEGALKADVEARAQKYMPVAKT